MTAEPFFCYYRRARFINCHCARFDDGSCVPPEFYPEFARRRDSEQWTRLFADRGQYAQPFEAQP